MNVRQERAISFISKKWILRRSQEYQYALNCPRWPKKDFFTNDPASKDSKGFENNIQMENEEAFINPGDAYLKKLNSNKSEGSAPKFKADQYLGDFISSTETQVFGGFDGFIYKKLLANFSHLRHTRKTPWIKYFVNFVRENIND